MPKPKQEGAARAADEIFDLAYRRLRGSDDESLSPSEILAIITRYCPALTREIKWTYALENPDSDLPFVIRDENKMVVATVGQETDAKDICSRSAGREALAQGLDLVMNEDWLAGTIKAGQPKPEPYLDRDGVRTVRRRKLSPTETARVIHEAIRALKTQERP